MVVPETTNCRRRGRQGHGHAHVRSGAAVARGAFFFFLGPVAALGTPFKPRCRLGAGCGLRRLSRATDRGLRVASSPAGDPAGSPGGGAPSGLLWSGQQRARSWCSRARIPALGRRTGARQPGGAARQLAETALGIAEVVERPPLPCSCAGGRCWPLSEMPLSADMDPEQPRLYDRLCPRGSTEA